MVDNEEKTEVVEEAVVETKSDAEVFGDKMDEILTEPPAGEEETVSEETEQGDEVSEELEETPAGEELSAEDTEVLEGINPEVLEYCRDYYGDDAKILEQAKLTPDLFDDIRAVLDEEKTETKSAVAEKPKEEPVVDELDAKLAKLDPDVHGAEIVGLLRTMAERQKQGTKVLTESQDKLQKRENEAFNAKIETIFDGHTKGFSELGTSSKPTKDSGELRKDVFAVAIALGQRRNKSPETMIGQAVKLFKNQGGEKVAGQKLLNKLEKQKKRFTNAPTRRHSDIKSRKFATEEEKKEAIMTEAYKEAGIEE